MRNLSIKNVPEELAQALRRRAARNGRSLQGELMAIIAQAVAQEAAAAPATCHAPTSWRQGTRSVEDLVKERRTIFPEPVRGFPLAVDLIREERDSR